MKEQKFREFTQEDQKTWKTLFNNLVDNRRNQAVPMFAHGLEKLEMTAECIPDLNEVNQRLGTITGWKGIPVEGLEEGDSFYPALGERIFPLGNFIRDPNVLSYTPAPDIFHDLYGHIPFYCDEDYAEFCERYGKVAGKYVDQPAKLRQFERFFWFTVEFGLLETNAGRRIFGAGLLSSYGESNYALSDEPKVLPFDIDVIRNQEFKIDEYQKVLFVMKNKEQLYSSLEELERRISCS